MKKNRWGLDRSQRMQLKGFVCLLGFLLLTALLALKITLSCIHRDEAAPEEEPGEPPGHIAVVQEFSNVWILEADGERLIVFREGQRETYPVSEEMSPVSDALREQLADLQVTDGVVTAAVPKTEKINGRILGADQEGIEVEGYGRLPVAADCKGYRLYGSLQMCTPEDIWRLP